MASLLFCIGLYAQGGAVAQISGTVKDQSGAVLPGVEVTLTQTATSATRMTVTNETGSYAIPNLPVGPYKLKASLPGFVTFVQTGIVLQVNSNPAINIVLQIGQVSQTLEIQADVAMVETRSTGVGQVIDNQRVLEMPLNGRNLTDLILLSGAAVVTGGFNGNRNYPTQAISVAGVRAAERRTCSTVPITTTFITTSICLFPSRTLCRNSKSRPAPFPLGMDITQQRL